MVARNLFGLLALMASCAAQPAMIAQPVEVKVPVPVRAAVPQDLQLPVVTDALPEFVEPGAQGTTVALTAAGVQRLQALLWALRSRVTQWEAAYGVERRR